MCPGDSDNDVINQTRRKRRSKKGVIMKDKYHKTESNMQQKHWSANLQTNGFEGEDEKWITFQHKPDPIDLTYTARSVRIWQRFPSEYYIYICIFKEKYITDPHICGCLSWITFFYCFFSISNDPGTLCRDVTFIFITSILSFTDLCYFGLLNSMGCEMVVH